MILQDISVTDMKKFIAIMVMLLIGLVANAQFITGGSAFKLGDYYFNRSGGLNGWTSCKDDFYGYYEYDAMDEVEANILEEFIVAHAEELEEKYGVVFWCPELRRLDPKYPNVRRDRYISSHLIIYVCTKEYYEKKVAERDKKLAEAKAEKQKRINSLNDIL